MPEVRATLIVSAKDEASPVLGKIGGAGTKAGKETKAGFADATKALTGFDVASLGGIAGVTALTGAMIGSIKYTLDWAGSIDKLSRNTGLSTEEASKLAVVAGDVGIEIGTLERALKSMTKQGLELNIDTLKRVSAEYQAAESPVDRMKIATKAFGAAAQDMTEILSRTPEELDALAASAERSGKVMSEENVAAAEQFEQSLTQLKDTVQGLMVTFGNVAIPTLNKAGETLMNEAKIAAIVAIEFQRMTGQIDYNEAAQRAAAVAAGDLSAALQEQADITDNTVDAHGRAAAATETVAAGTYLLDIQTQALASTWQSYVPTVSDAVVENEIIRKKLEELTGTASDLAFGMGELTTATLYHQAAQGLDADAAYELAKQMGLINPAADAAKSVLDELRTKLEEGALSTSGYTKSVDLLDAAVRSLPSGQTITIEIFEQYRRQYMDEFNAENSGQVGGAVGDGYAHGGNVYANQPAIVGDSGRPELFVPRSDGYIYPVVPSANTSTTGDGGGMDSGLMMAAIMNLPRAIRDALMR